VVGSSSVGCRNAGLENDSPNSGSGKTTGPQAIIYRGKSFFPDALFGPSFSGPAFSIAAARLGRGG